MTAVSLRLAPDAAIDFQLHTVRSDGVWTLEAPFAWLRSERFGLVALTDHDRPDTAAGVGLRLMRDGAAASCWSTDRHLGLVGTPLAVRAS